MTENNPSNKLALREEVDNILASPPTPESYRKIKDFLRQHSFALSIANAAKILVNLIPDVGAGLGEAINQMSPNPEMDLLINHVEDLSQHINRLREKLDSIDEKLNEPQTRILIVQTIEESVHNEGGGKWEFYRNLLLNTITDKELSKATTHYYHQRINELSSLELIGLANLYKTKMSTLPTESQTAFKHDLQGSSFTRSDLSKLCTSLINLENSDLSFEIFNQLSHKKYLDSPPNVHNRLFADLSAKLGICGSENRVEKVVSGFESLVETETIAPYYFTPWVLEFTKSISTHPGEATG